MSQLKETMAEARARGTMLHGFMMALPEEKMNGSTIMALMALVVGEFLLRNTPREEAMACFGEIWDLLTSKPEIQTLQRELFKNTEQDL